MASRTLPVLTHPSFPQVFTPAMHERIRRIGQILNLCDHEDEKYCCPARATVHHLSSGQELCLSHFRDAEVTLG